MTRKVSITEANRIILTSNATGFKGDGKYGEYHLFSKNDIYRMLIGECICIVEKNGEEIELDGNNESKIRNIWKEVSTFGGKGKNIIL